MTGLVLALLIGISLGLLGGGGSILTVPVLVYAMGYAPKPAIAMSMPIIGITSLAGAAMHFRLGNVQLRTAALFGMLTMLGAFAGAKLSVFMSGSLQLVLLATVMLAAAVSMLRSSGTETAKPRGLRLHLLIPVALAVGVLTGLVGIGGGFLVVPALVVLTGIPMQQAVGTSLLVIAMNSAAGFAGYPGKDALDWKLLAGFAALAVVGSLLGARYAKSVPQVTLKRAFAVLLLVVGAVMLVQRG